MTNPGSPEQQKDKVIGIKILKQGTFTKKLKKNKYSSSKSKNKDIKVDENTSDAQNPQTVTQYLPNHKNEENVHIKDE